MNIKAALGPTNTGKTFYAIERMASYKSGIIGLPLRLLTKEVFDKISNKLGPSRTAMITGEERIIPKNPKYWVCTVESMPTDIPVDFVAIDEIQLLNDPERGYAFTEKILQMRGMHETLLMGSDTVEKLIKKLIPHIKFINRSRYSKLTYSGYKKITNLPRRSAVVAFSMDSVYSIAEVLRKHKGGVAIIMGALSPRTRNAQVKMYQEGEVDYIVATDAIGMGLNLDLNHVVFAEDRKFDGKQYRNLTAHELGQIAGRAGRYKKNGTFGVTATVSDLNIKNILAIENHEYEKKKFAFWRNNKLNFDSLEKLIKSLELDSGNHLLKKTPPPDDFKTLKKLSENQRVKNSLNDKNNLKLFWDLCQIPDFRQNNEIYHLNLIENIYFHLLEKGKLTDEAMNKYTKKLNSGTLDDIYSISEKLSEIRTWSFVSNKSSWVNNSQEWQVKTRNIEDDLSDYLHQALTERFVDVDSKKLFQQFDDQNEYLAGINENGDVTINSDYYGKMEGLRFLCKKSIANRRIQNTLNSITSEEIKKRISKIIKCSSKDLSLDSSLIINFKNEPIARLVKGNSILKPNIEIIIERGLEVSLTKKLKTIISNWVKEKINYDLYSLIRLEDSNLKYQEKGIAYRIVEELGSIDRKKMNKEINSLDLDSRRNLKKYGIIIGKYSIYIKNALKPQYTSILPGLWLIYHKENLNLERIKIQINSLPKPGITSCIINTMVFKNLYKYCGYKVLGSNAVRIDILERLDKMIYETIKENKNKNQFLINDQMISLLGTSPNELKQLLKELGYLIKKEDDDAKKIIWFADIKKTRKLYTEKKRSKSQSNKSKNGIFKDTDIKSLKDKLSTK